jgi:hypothetical protein
MNQRIVGLDVSKDNVVACLLTEFPSEPRQFYLQGDFHRLYANTMGIKKLLALEPDVAVLEPTGVNYSKIWITKLAENGVKIKLVGHKELRVYRSGLDLPDKDDEADSLALACYYLQYQQIRTRFVRERDEVIAYMRDRVLRLHHLNRIQNPLNNRIKQDLAWAFPERCKSDMGARLFWRWLAGQAKSVKYDSELADTCGSGLTDDIRFAANQIYQVHQREAIIEKEIQDCIQDRRFTPYRKVFKTFGFGERTEALILSQIFPLENYLDGLEPITILSRSRENPKKKTIKRISERKFKKALGVAPERDWSGDGKKTKKAGSQLCRTALWQWIFTRIEVKRARLKNETFEEIAAYFDTLKEKNIPIKLARSKTAGLAVRRLFYALVDALKQEREITSEQEV